MSAPSATTVKRVYDYLFNAAGNVALSTELKEITWRFGACILILRKHGHCIKTAHDHGRVWRYTLTPDKTCRWKTTRRCKCK